MITRLIIGLDEAPFTDYLMSIDMTADEFNEKTEDEQKEIAVKYLASAPIEAEEITLE